VPQRGQKALQPVPMRGAANTGLDAAELGMDERSQLFGGCEPQIVVAENFLSIHLIKSTDWQMHAGGSYGASNARYSP
jgi:hypothetical protein